MLQVYKTIQNQPHLYVNTTFEFIAETNMKFNTIAEEFKEGTIKNEIRRSFQCSDSDSDSEDSV
jgi:hypothetical protein